MEQAKWYFIKFNDWVPYHMNYKYLGCYYFKYLVWLLLLYSDHGFRRMILVRRGNSYGCKIFCGKKKLNKLIMETHLLGLEDELLIFERKGETK